PERLGDGDRRKLLRSPAIVERGDDRHGGLLDLSAFDFLDEAVDRLADPRVVAAGPLEAQLVAKDVLELAVVEGRELREREPESLVQRASRVRPRSLEPPASGIDPEGREALEG